MATYSNTHFILTHIRNSFITTDDTGVSELVMSDDLPRSYSRRLEQECGSSNRVPNIYPGLDDQDSDELSQSYGINFGHDTHFYRIRTNTDAKLQKLMRARRDQANQVTVKYACEPQKHENDEELFKRKEVCEPPDIPPGQSFEERLLSFPPIEKNKFYMYSKFDGTSNTESKTIHVFIMPFPKEQRVYPITFTVQSKAKIVEFIGFILHGCYVQFPEISKKVDFQEVNDYSLYISDESGEVDSDFPPLDNNEQIQKFHFSHLALGKKSTQSFQTRTFSVVSDSMATSARILLEKDETTTTVASNFSHSVEAASSATDAFVDTLVYQAFRVNLISKRHFKSEVQLGISGERIEIDPLQQKPSSYFFRSFKAIHYSFESVAWCEITSRKSNRFEFKIAHIPVSVGDPMFTSFDDSMMTSSLKVHSFETDPTTAEIICRKINRILDSKKTPVLREFFNRSDRTKRSFLRKRKFFL